MFTDMVATALILKNSRYTIWMVRKHLLEHYPDATPEFIEQSIKKAFGFMAYYFGI